MKYDVALSFASEDRPYVKSVALELARHDVRFFFDEFEVVDCWGKDLYYNFQDIFQNQAKYTVIFISKHYARKLWTNHERKAAQARAFGESVEYILPARFDDTEIAGILPTTGYIDLRRCTPSEFCEIIIKKLRIAKTLKTTENSTDRPKDSFAGFAASPKHEFSDSSPVSVRLISNPENDRTMLIRTLVKRSLIAFASLLFGITLGFNLPIIILYFRPNEPIGHLIRIVIPLVLIFSGTAVFFINNNYIKYFLQLPVLGNEPRFVGDGEVIRRLNWQTLLITKPTAPCIYGNCWGSVELERTPERERGRVSKAFVGICTVCGSDHSYKVDATLTATKSPDMDFRPLNKD